MQNPLNKNQLSPLKRRFRGGVYIREKSTFGRHMLIKNVPFVELPLLSRSGEIMTACVEEGQHVMIGETLTAKIPESRERLIAPVSGTVSFCDVLWDGANTVPAVRIENDLLFEQQPFDDDISELTRETIINRLDLACVCCGDVPLADMIDYAYQDAELVIRGLNTDPFITSARASAFDLAEDVVKGAGVLQKIFPRVHIVLDKDDTDILRLYSTWLSGRENIYVFPMKAEYPHDDRRVLSALFSGRRIGSSLSGRSCVAIDAYTAAAVSRAVFSEKSDVMRMVSVTGDAISAPENVLAPVGTAFSSLVSACGGYSGQPRRIISGGTLTGTALYTDSVPVSRKCEGFLAFEGGINAAPDPCISCGRCNEVCPAGLLPSYIYRFMSAGMPERCEGLHTEECIHCAACDYVCPARLPLSAAVKTEKRGEVNG